MVLFPPAPVKQLYSKNSVFSIEKPQLVGVLNITPDSFSDGGRFQSVDQVLEYVYQMIEQGADWIDIGGESSGPGSKSVSTEEELQRVIPVIEKIRKYSDIWLSLDTYKAEVARQAITAGVNVINDVTALRGDPEMVEVIAQENVPVVLMYSKDPDARTSTDSIEYGDVVGTIKEFFKERLIWSQLKGIKTENIIIDPGMGFFISGSARYSFELIKRLPEIVEWGYPVMIGPSRKSFLADVTPGKTLWVHQREIPSATAAAISAWQGAKLLRLHDVAQGRLVLDTVHCIETGDLIR